MSYFFFGTVRPDPSGHTHVTVTPEMAVAGGTKEEHADAVRIVELFSEGVKQDGIHHAREILKDAVRKVKG